MHHGPLLCKLSSIWGRCRITESLRIFGCWWQVKKTSLVQPLVFCACLGYRVTRLKPFLTKNFHVCLNFAKNTITPSHVGNKTTVGFNFENYVMQKDNVAHRPHNAIATVMHGASGLLPFSCDRGSSQDRRDNEELQISRYFGTKPAGRSQKAEDEEEFQLPISRRAFTFLISKY